MNATIKNYTTHAITSLYDFHGPGQGRCITINSILVHEYTFLVDGNGGEEQAAVMVSPTQSGRFSLDIAITSVDGGNPRHELTRFLKHLTPYQFKSRLRMWARDWTSSNAQAEILVRVIWDSLEGR